MKFADFISHDSICVPLQARDKPGAIGEMVGAMASIGDLRPDEAESVIARVLKHEALGSTGIGDGLAIPEAWWPSGDRVVGTVAVSTEGVDFYSLDGSYVQVIFLLLVPPRLREQGIDAINRILDRLRDKRFRTALKKAQTRGEVRQLLDDADTT
jgi:mannitol/fructose-specific phosphotransferase system IIA component (Ntr-type)